MFCERCGVQLAPVSINPPPPPILLSSAEPAPAAPEVVQPVQAKVCPSCGFSNLVDEVFCARCGYQLDGPAALVEPPLEPMELVEATAAVPVEAPSGAPLDAPPGVPICPTCGFAYSPGSLFCADCGSPLGVTAAADTAPVAKVHDAVATGLPAAIQGKFKLTFNGALIELPAGKTEIVLGRVDPKGGYAPDIDLSVYGTQAVGISRKHARLVIDGGKLCIEDLESTNFTLLNKQKLRPRVSYPLTDGDEVRLARLQMVYQST